MFESISPLFSSKPVVIVANKVDLVKLEDVEDSYRKRIEEIAEKVSAQVIEMSSHSDIGITDVKRAACEKLLTQRMQKKLNSNKISSILNRITVVKPSARDGKERPAFIPEAVIVS